MKFFHRFEVWLLLALSLGGAIWVFSSRETGDRELATLPADTAPQPAIKILRCTLERDFGNARLDIELRYQNSSPRALTLQPPDARLVAGGGKEVAPFILPIEKPPQIPAQSAQDVRLRYWLETADLQGTLTLDIRGQTAEIKTAAPLDLAKLENRKPKTWTGAIEP